VQTTKEKKIAIVCNKLAGVGRSIVLADKIASELLSRQIPHSLFKENWPAVFDDFTDVWISGGDGTLNYFVNHYPGINLPLVIFKGGTGNDFHWLLYGEVSVEEQIQLVLNTEPKPIDLGRCNEKFFLNDIGIGFEAAVAKGLRGKKKKAGKTSFMIMILKKIFSYRSKPYHIWSDTMLINKGKYLIVDVNNGSRAGGGFQIAPEARADDGLLDLILIKAMPPIERLRWLPVIEKGKHLNRSFISYSRTKRVVIESDETIESHLDGEYYTCKRMEIEILPAKLLFCY
jgi:diacylglycerol kinase (ATP)